MITYIDFAEDVAIVAETSEVLAGTVDTLTSESEPHGLKVSWIKTEIKIFVLAVKL